MPVDDGDETLTVEEVAAEMAPEPSDDDFAPYDPRITTTTSPGPASSRDAPPLDQEPLPVVDGPTFDEKHALPFEGLLFLGALTDTFTWVGHKFTIRTLRVEETLEVALLSRPYQGTLGEIKAYQSALVAACVVSVDGQPIALPLSDQDSSVTAKFDYIRNHWFPPVLDKIYEKYLLLERVALEVLERMGESSGQA